ncbi:hypothetical protein JW710_04370 [Candidatus Dojkabacteria bacterium]|nr:hypothetical protein [Candidatus Dojkabacteria bacterium]
MSAEVNETDFVFDDGTVLQMQPEDCGIEDLLGGFTARVLDVVDRTGICLVAGQSGLGKTELFLGENMIYKPSWKNLRAGGIVEAIEERGKIWRFMNVAHIRGGLQKNIDEIIDAAEDQRPDYILFDEGGHLAMENKANIPERLKKLIDLGLKIVFVIGGAESPSKSNNQIAEILERAGVHITDEQKIIYPPLMLNDNQATTILGVNCPRSSKAEIAQTLQQARILNVPTILSVVQRLYPGGDITEEAVKNYRYGISYVGTEKNIEK